MNCPICKKKMKVFPSVQTGDVVQEWGARCERGKHEVYIYSETRKGLAIELNASNKPLKSENHTNPECGICGGEHFDFECPDRGK